MTADELAALFAANPDNCRVRYSTLSDATVLAMHGRNLPMAWVWVDGTAEPRTVMVADLSPLPVPLPTIERALRARLPGVRLSESTVQLAAKVLRQEFAPHLDGPHGDTLRELLPGIGGDDG